MTAQLTREDLARNWSFQNDPEAIQCPFRAGAKLHEGPEIFFKAGEAHVRAEGLGGNWVVTRQALQEEILLDPARFSSYLSIGFSRLAGDDWPLVPLELDPPEHGVYRKLVAPWFSLNKARELQEEIRTLAVNLIEKFRNEGKCEFMADFGQPYPVTVFLLMMGLPTDQMPIFLRWADDLLRGETMEIRGTSARAIKAYLLEVIEERRRNPGTDIVSFLLDAQIDGAPLSPDRLMGVCFMLFIGGLDTVASSLGFVFRELALRPELQDQLRANPEMVNAATDEFTRAFGVVTTFRYATCDMDFHGVQIRKGDLIELPLGLSSRDPSVYENPHEIDFGRRFKRSISFSTGPHICAGMHLARTEIRIALEEWTKRMPKFRITPGATVTAATESVWALNALPLEWN